MAWDSFVSTRWHFVPASWAEVMRLSEQWQRAFTNARITADFG